MDLLDVSSDPGGPGGPIGPISPCMHGRQREMYV